MSKKHLISGIILIIISVWFYSALSSFKEEKHSFPKRIIIREGSVRTETEVAEALAKDLDFDLQGAYKSGYTQKDVIEYLMKQPHKVPITYYDGKFYHGRITVLYIIPLSVCIFLGMAGIIIILTGKKKKKAS